MTKPVRFAPFPLSTTEPICFSISCFVSEWGSSLADPENVFYENKNALRDYLVKIK